MITPEKIDEWIKEIEERPTSGATIVRYIANRLRDLTARNEELLSENILLRTGQKVEELEMRTAFLESQLELLKRQVVAGGEALMPAAETINLLLFTPAGRVLRVELPSADLQPGETVAQLNPQSAGVMARLLEAGQQEELLFIFDSGRTTRLPVSKVPKLEGTAADWQQGLLQEPRGGEELAAVLPVARLPLFDFGIQVSRRGCVKKTMRPYLESHVAKGYVGSGVKANLDRAFSLLLVHKDDHIVLATREGVFIEVDIDLIPYNVEEALRLSASDFVVDAFVKKEPKPVIFVTQTGKIVQREPGWLEPVSTFKTRGQAALSAARKEAGVRLAAAAQVLEKSWAAALHSDGRLIIHRLDDLLAQGAVPAEGASEVLAFTVFQIVEPGKTEPDAGDR